MMRVIGIDFAVSATGIASVDANGQAETFSAKTEPAGIVYEDRAERLWRAVQSVIAVAQAAQLVVIEGPAISKHDRGVWDRAGAWWLIYMHLVSVNVPVAVCPPSTLKNWATGDGRADKKLVRARMQAMWPNVRISNMDESDALALATMGAQQLGYPVPSIEWHGFARESVEWPRQYERPASRAVSCES